MSDTVSDFINAACVPLEGDHASGPLDKAEQTLRSNPEVATADIYAAAVLGHADSVKRFIETDESLATAKGGARNWDALTYLCFSRYLRIQRNRSADFVRTASALLDAGSNPNTGWFEATHQPNPTWESAIYGAAGVARDAHLTRCDFLIYPRCESSSSRPSFPS